MIETVLADFRSWLEQLSRNAPAEATTSEQGPAIDLHTLLSQFVALRHEVNLQTKAARAQQEVTTQAVTQLQQALEMVRQAARDPAVQAEAHRPLLKTLLDVRDALSLAEREIRRTQQALHRASGQSTGPQAPALPPTEAARPSFWQRWFGTRPRPTEAGAHAPIAGQPAGERDALLDSVVAGYRMSLQRLERALEQSGLEPIPCVGQPFDPDLMEVVAAVANSHQPAGTVLEEVRRGYLWHDRVFRYAQVTVARALTANPAEERRETAGGGTSWNRS